MKLKVIADNCFTYKNDKLSYLDYSTTYIKITELLQELEDVTFSKIHIDIVKDVKLECNKYTFDYFIEKEYLIKYQEKIKKIIERI